MIPETLANGRIVSSQSPSTPLPGINAHLSFLSAIILISSSYPSFERETIHPILGKLSVSLVKLIERCCIEPRTEWIILVSMQAIRKSSNDMAFS